MLVCDTGQQRLDSARLDLVHMATRGTEQELALVSMIGMVARKVRLHGLKPVDEAGSHEEVQVTVDGKGCDFSILPLLQQRDEFVGGKRTVVGQHFRVNC